MANDWLKIKVDGTSEWGTTGTGPSGTTGITISADTCSEAIARCATIVFRAGSLTKRLKVTQGISASPKIQLVPSFLTIGKNQTGTTNLTVSNVSEITGWYWVLTSPSTQSLINGVDIYNGNTSISLPYTGVGVSSTAIKVKNKTNDTGNLVLQGTLYSSDDTQLSSQNVNFQLTGDQNPEPVIHFDYGTTMTLYCGSTQTVNMQIKQIPTGARYEWEVLFTNGYQGVTATPVSGSGTTNNVVIPIVFANDARTSGGDSVKARVHVWYADGSDNWGSTQTIELTFLPVDYNYRLVVDTQPLASLAYNQTTSVAFHVIDTNGHAISENGLSWTLTCNENWMNAQLNRNPGEGDFTSNNNYSGSSQLTNTSISWNSTSVTLTLKLFKDGTVIDVINSTQSLDRYINAIQLTPDVYLTLMQPEPNQGLNYCGTTSSAGGVQTVQFVSNMPWTAFTESTENGFYINTEGNYTAQGTASVDSNDVKTLSFICPSNPSPTQSLENALRIEQIPNTISRYVRVKVTTSAPTLHIVDDGNIHMLSYNISQRELALEIQSNLTTYGVYYLLSNAPTSKPSWIDVTIEYNNSKYYMVVSTTQENTGEERPEGSLEIGLSANTNGTTIYSDNTVRVKQSAKPEEAYSIYVDNTLVWGSAPDAPKTTTFEVPWTGISADRQTPYTVRIAWNGGNAFFNCTGAGRIYKLQNGNWEIITDPNYQGTEVKLAIPENTTNSTAETQVRLSTDDKALWTGNWWQDVKPAGYDDRYTVTWHTGGHTSFDISVTIGSGSVNLPISTPFKIYVTDSTGTIPGAHVMWEGTKTLTNSGTYLTVNNTYNVTLDTEEDFSEQKGNWVKMCFEFNGIRSDFVTLPSESGTQTSPNYNS